MVIADQHYPNLQGKSAACESRKSETTQNLSKKRAQAGSKL